MYTEQHKTNLVAIHVYRAGLARTLSADEVPRSHQHGTHVPREARSRHRAGGLSLHRRHLLAHGVLKICLAGGAIPAKRSKSDFVYFALERRRSLQMACSAPALPVNARAGNLPRQFSCRYLWLSQTRAPQMLTSCCHLSWSFKAVPPPVARLLRTMDVLLYHLEALCRP